MVDENKLKKSDIFPFEAIDVFDVVIDIEKYPQFLPWCKDIKIISKEKNRIIADTFLSFKGIEVTYNSIIDYVVPNKNQNGYIKVHANNSIFKYLSNIWQFIPNGSNTTVKFFIDFQLHSSSMQALLNKVYSKAQKKVIQLFYERIKQINKGF